MSITPEARKLYHRLLPKSAGARRAFYFAALAHAYLSGAKEITVACVRRARSFILWHHGAK